MARGGPYLAVRYGEVKSGESEVGRGLGNIILARLDDLFSWAVGSSLWPLTFGPACCAMEMMAAGAARFDLDRIGVFFRPSPRQADVMITAGTITLRMAPVMRRLYEQMPEPKYVVAMGGCAISGGPFRDSYAVLQGVGDVIPVDVYLPGCPPRPEALIDAIMKLREKIRRPEVAKGHA